MKILKKGSTEDFKRALEEKITQLEGTDVNSATNLIRQIDIYYKDHPERLYDAEYLYSYKNFPIVKNGSGWYGYLHGRYSIGRRTPEEVEQFIDEEELKGSVNSSTNTSGIAASDSTDSERFIHNLIGDIESELDGEIDNISFDQDDENLYVTVTYMGHVKEYKVPFSDLTMNFDTIEQDSSCIVNTVLMDLDNVDDEGFHDYNEVNGSTNDSRYEKNDDPQDFVNYVDAVLQKLESVGCDIDDGEVIDYAEAAAEMIANDDDHDVEYWWNETKKNFMDEIDELPHN